MDRLIAASEGEFVIVGHAFDPQRERYFWKIEWERPTERKSIGLPPAGFVAAELNAAITRHRWWKRRRGWLAGASMAVLVAAFFLGGYYPRAERYPPNCEVSADGSAYCPAYGGIGSGEAALAQACEIRMGRLDRYCNATYEEQAAADDLLRDAELLKKLGLKEVPLPFQMPFPSADE